MSKDEFDAVKAAINCLKDIEDALSGKGTLTGQSLHLGTNKRYKTMARDAASKLEKALASLKVGIDN